MSPANYTVDNGGSNDDTSGWQSAAVRCSPTSRSNYWDHVSKIADGVMNSGENMLTPLPHDL